MYDFLTAGDFRWEWILHLCRTEGPKVPARSFWRRLQGSNTAKGTFRFK